MEKALNQRAESTYSTHFKKAFPLTTYGEAKERLQRYEIEDSQLGLVTVLRKEHKESSLELRGIRSSKPINVVPVTKTVVYYSVVLGEDLVRDKEKAKEIIQRLSGVSLPKSSRIVTDKTLFDEVEILNPSNIFI
jgi:hypothetical protein